MNPTLEKKKIQRMPKSSPRWIRDGANLVDPERLKDGTALLSLTGLSAVSWALVSEGFCIHMLQ